ncbi:hypothetical protein HU200_057544 [Digitaria exilis]|uniref:Uncharacterized protein n=1 Tax=Digitaria exilis TaxID=1010633 RepID=A0A835AB40_9POAL|nr:hypothetical protein HU200_057544 [Digitaria exilis]
MAKRRALERRGVRAAKRQQALERGGGRAAKQHLYLIFDDWRRGYSIRKVDLSSDGFASGEGEPPAGWQMAARASGGWEMVCTGNERLPPAIFRVEAQRGLPTYFAAAFDSKILAMAPPMAPAAEDALPSVLERHFPVFDVRTRGCLFVPRMETTGADPIYIPAGGKLFAVADGTFDKLDPVNPPPVTAREMPAYGEEARDWSWLELPDPTFKRRRVTSYAVHPDDHTIFVSTKKGDAAATVTVDTADPGEWKKHGNIGHLCACDTVPADHDAGGDSQCPAWKVSKEKLLCDEPTERHVGATLLYTGSRSEFCLVQCVSIVDDRADEWSDGDLEDQYDDSGYSDLEEEDLLDHCICCVEDDGAADECKEDEQDVTSRTRRYMLRLTTFTLKYDKNGDLTTGGSCRVLYYRVPKRSTVALLSNPVAFWM